jgi:hypothetical protein
MVPYLFYLILYPLLLLLSIFAGRRTAARSHRKSHQWKPLGVENGLMGFYGLLVSFTLVQSSNNAKERTEMTQRLADELSGLLRVAQTLDPGLRNEIRSFTFKSYRIMDEKRYDKRDSADAAITQVEILDKELDKYFLEYIKNNPASKPDIVSIMVKMDHLESVAYRILHSYHRRVPVFTLFVLIIYSLLMAFLIGFIGKYHGNHIYISTTIFVVISFVAINFIHDLDTPSRGFIKPNFEDINEVMKIYGIDKP